MKGCGDDAANTFSDMRIRTPVLVTLIAAVALPLPAATSGPDEGVFVVRFDGRITDAARTAVVGAGLRILDYEPHDSYLAYGSGVAAERAAALGSVASVAPLDEARKIHPSLLGRSGLLRVDVTAYGPALGRLRADLGGLGDLLGTYEATADGRLAGLGLLVPAADVAAIAADPAVVYIQPAGERLTPEDEATAQIQAGNLTAVNRPEPGYAAWLASRNLDGSGVKVTVVDTGIESFHPDVLGRVTKLQNYASAAEQNDLFGHGTHVAGIIGGDPPTGLIPRDPDGFVLGSGVAPGVEMLDINSVGFTGAFPPSSFEEYTSASWAWGSRMWNASWTTGGGAKAGYTARARQMDELSRDAVFATPGMEEFLLVFSAGNSGTAGLTEPKEAKNIISVGATASGRGLRWPLTTNVDTVASFSSRGPAKDGRILPTISAPGENVISARAPVAAGLVLGACVPDTFSPLHAPCSGTSMASPHVAGAAALIHQWWKRETGGSLPSPAMVKALLVNGATDIGTKNIPNRDEGWGRVNVANVVGGMPELQEDQGIVFGGPGEERSYLVEVPEGEGPFRTTVAWSDAPGAPGASPALVNDLDLVVERLDAEGQVVQTWLGNRFAGGQSVMGGARDVLNNLENVYLNVPAPGAYRVTIRAVNVPGDGIPGNEDPTDQDFALVLRGATGATDELYALQWGLRSINAPAAWDVSTGEGTRVAIIGDGVDFEHPDLAGKVVDGTAFMGCSTNPDGCGTGHWNDNKVSPGTHETVIAGIVAARANNGIGVAGVAPDADIIAINVSQPGQLGYLRSDVLAGIRWAVDHGADVINLSLGGGPLADSLLGNTPSDYDDVIRYARQRDVVMVASAGNAPVKGCDQPARVEGVICATAVGPNGVPAPYSSSALPMGTEVVAAPGGMGSANGGAACHLDVVSTVAPVGAELYCTGLHPGYGFGAGTSFAAPHVAGVAALLASQCRSATEIVRVLQETARNPVSGERGVWDPSYGYGIVDAAAAVAAPIVDRRTSPRPGVESDPCFSGD